MLLEIIIICLAVVKQHARFTSVVFKSVRIPSSKSKKILSESVPSGTGSDLVQNKFLANIQATSGLVI